MKDILEFHFFISEKVLVLTPNKVASRFVGNVFKMNDGSHVIISVNTDLTIIENGIKNQKGHNIHDTEYIIKEYNSILENTSKKDILILYRNPYNRLLTGIVQHFYRDLFPTGISNYSFNFKFRLILESTQYGLGILKKFEFTNTPHNIYNTIQSLNNKELDGIKSIFLKYIYYYPSEDLFKESHVAPYISYLYTILSKNNYKSNIMYFDIDDINHNLSNQLTKYFKFDSTWTSTIRSNSMFTENFKLDSDLDSAQIKKVKNKLLNLTKVEMFFYNKFKLLPNNINFIDE